MKLKTTIIISLIVAVLAQPIGIFSFETDQYNLPPEPLVDIGDEVTDYVQRQIQLAITRINSEIVEAGACVESDPKNKNCDSPDELSKRLAYLRSNDAVAKEIFKRLGDGIFPFTNVSVWIEWHKFAESPARYKTSFKDSIHLTAPFNYLTISPTVNIYDTKLGTDKIAHIFQQGYAYYKIHKRATSKDADDPAAIEKAVRWGQKTERTYYGYWVSGIYSNADLAANYAGLRFYQGLTSDLKIGNTVRPATLTLMDGLWKINDGVDIRETLIKPFVSNHLNEAYNPSKFFNVLGFRDRVRRVVRKQACPQWLERFPGLSQAELEATTESLELWHGEDYGFTPGSNFITISNTCFGENDAAADATDN